MISRLQSVSRHLVVDAGNASEAPPALCYAKPEASTEPRARQVPVMADYRGSRRDPRAQGRSCEQQRQTEIDRVQGALTSSSSPQASPNFHGQHTSQCQTVNHAPQR